MTSEAERLADEYRRLVCKRTGIRPEVLVCPREQSDMTPCVARDGALAVFADGDCVGCGARVQELIAEEMARPA